MSVRISDAEHVALYDSVTGTAFGPTFMSESDAADFLDWLEVDPRGLAAWVLGDCFEAWRIGAPRSPAVVAA